MRSVAASAPELEACRSAAIRFVIGAYDGVATRPGRGLPHAQAVCDVLRDAGRGELVQVVGLLHDVVEDTPRTIDDVREGFGDRVAGMVDALTEDESIRRYAQRKRQLRSRIVAAGTAVLDVSLADKVATLRDALSTGRPLSARKLTHYRATLQLGLAGGGSQALCTQLEGLLSAMPRA
jgi:(p)ppGpp synthase/HD superfamily hydrolase